MAVFDQRYQAATDSVKEASEIIQAVREDRQVN